jgi:CubicO group peptidase (beta-lactamase class C family)
VGGSFGMMRPRDWLRLGQLVANNGNLNGQQLVSPQVMQQLLAPSPTEPGYGGHIWRQSASFIPADLQARLPADLVCFSGSMGQFTVIVPSLNLVVVRMGVSFDRKRLISDVFRFTAELVEAY